MRFEIYQRRDQLWGWRLRADNGEKVAASRGYTEARACQDTVELIKANAADAEIVIDVDPED